jgi:hypothetical protein
MVGVVVAMATRGLPLVYDLGVMGAVVAAAYVVPKLLWPHQIAWKPAEVPGNFAQRAREYLAGIGVGLALRAFILGTVSRDDAASMIAVVFVVCELLDYVGRQAQRERGWIPPP